MQPRCQRTVGIGVEYRRRSLSQVEGSNMREHESESLRDLARGLLEDTRDLIREELVLARTEIRQELAAVRTVGVAFGAAAVVGFLGAVLLCVALGGALAALLNWPPWAGDGVIALLLLVGSYALVRYALATLSRIRALPKTTETLKENVRWMQGKLNEP